MKLGLGAAQFGMNYGVLNKTGRVSEGAVSEILQMAKGKGVIVIDTAYQYGCSEEVLGRNLPDDHGFMIVTKTPSIKSDEVTDKDLFRLENAFYESLKRLRQESIYALLLHSADDLFAKNGKRVMEKMEELKRKGLFEKIGVSVYTPEQIDKVLDSPLVDIVQVPCNVLDQRLLVGGHLKKLKERGIEIHVRSVFLQGILLEEPDNLHDYFAPVKTHLKNYHQYLKERGVSAVAAAINFVLINDYVDCALVGVCSAGELREILNNAKKAVTLDLDYERFAFMDPKILNPSLWNIS